MINLLLQNNINLLVLCKLKTITKPVGVLIVGHQGNQFISLSAGLSWYIQIH